MAEATALKLKDLSDKTIQKTETVTSTQKKSQKKGGLLQKLSEIGTVSSQEVVEFTRHMTVMLSAGVTIFEAITFLRDQSKNKVFASKLNKIIGYLNNGESLSSSMKRYPKVFPDIYTNIIQVGEKSGTLPKTMTDLANHLEDNEKFRKKVQGALIYPKIIMSVMVIFLVILFYFVMPRIINVFEGLNAEIPTATKVVIAITEFVETRILLLILLVPAIYLLTKLMLKSRKIRKYRDMTYIKMPLIGRIALNYNTAQVSQHFGTLFESGLTIPKCLEITRSVIKNVIFQEEIDYMVSRIKGGSSFSASFNEDSIFPAMFVKLIKVGERTGKLPHVISYMKGYYKGLVDSDVKNISSVIEPVIMVLLGLMVAGLVVTVIGPIYQLISNISQ